MKKLLTGMIFIGSLSSFASDICIVRTHSTYGYKSVDCTNSEDRDALALSGSASKGLKDAFERGYELKSSNSAGSAVEHLLIKN